MWYVQSHSEEDPVKFQDNSDYDLIDWPKTSRHAELDGGTLVDNENMGSI